MTTVVCMIEQCPFRSSNKFCKSDTVILETLQNGAIVCKTGMIGICNQELDEYERRQKESVTNQRVDNQEHEVTES